MPQTMSTKHFKNVSKIVVGVILSQSLSSSLQNLIDQYGWANTENKMCGGGHGTHALLFLHDASGTIFMAYHKINNTNK